MRHVFIILCILVSVGDMPARIMSDSVTVYFPVSRSNLETGYMDNGVRLDRFMCHMDSVLLIHPAPVVRNVGIYGSASPEGSYNFNETLSRQRAKEILEFLESRLQVPDSIVAFRYSARNWMALRTVLGSDSAMPDRETMMSLLESNLSNNQDEITEAQSNRLLRAIRSLDGGKPYRMMLKKIFPFLREASLIITFYSAPEKVSPDSVAIKSGSVLAALGVPGIGIDIAVSHNFSVQGEWMYAWWSHRADNFFWRLYGGDIGLRWWFGKQAARRRLSGHHIGVYAQALIWDFEFGKRGYMGGVPGDAIWQRANIGAGVEYGYSLPVADRWNIDFCIGIGYLGESYREYQLYRSDES